ncbi:hypothetical protein HOY80DRAFT_886946, partial [Tuber brumale]
GIMNIIPLNCIELSLRERDGLRRAKITYLHIKVPEFTAPIPAQFDQIWSACHTAGVTTAYRDYGDGRGEMAMSAFQFSGSRALEDLDCRANGVQCPN